MEGFEVVLFTKWQYIATVLVYYIFWGSGKNVGGWCGFISLAADTYSPILSFLMDAPKLLPSPTSSACPVLVKEAIFDVSAKEAVFEISEQMSHLFVLDEHGQHLSRLMLELPWKIWVIIWSAWFMCVNGFRKGIYLKPKQRRWIGSVFEKTVWCSFYSDTRDEAVLSSILPLWGLRLCHTLSEALQLSEESLIQMMALRDQSSQTTRNTSLSFIYSVYFFMISSLSLSYCAKVVWLSSWETAFFPFYPLNTSFRNVKIYKSRSVRVVTHVF